MKKKTIYSLLFAVAGVVLVVAVGLRIYTGYRAGTAEPTRAVEAERIQPEDRTLGSIEYRVVSGDAEQSQARFLIDEVIFNRETEVEGTTDQIDGSFVLSFEQGTVDVGQFEINMRSIRTRTVDFHLEDVRPSSSSLSDSERDRVIRAYILESARDEFEFATFDPRSVSGTPDSFAPGDRLDLVVTGDLRIRDVTSSVSFDMEVFIDSEERISGSATTTILWDDFDISIPYVGGRSSIASVGEQVELELSFVAEAM
ncbi:MAG: YceI family protein [Spirochaetaceae bacterium]|nr:MAG: YceI family protein [Spirochaetaceae bacterium]